MPSLADYERDKAETQTQLDAIAAQIRDDPENAALLELGAELEDLLAALDEEISQLKPKEILKPTEPSPPQQEEKPAPGLKKEPAPTEDHASISYQVNDTVLAKWSSDKGWYPAKITSVTGSSTAPIYTVKYKSYDASETLRSRDIRPISNNRKPESQVSNSATSQPFDPAPSSGPGVVTSATATVYPGAKRELEKTEEEQAKPRKSKKIKAKKELETAKKNWNAFQQSKSGGKGKKDSMFRTPEGVRGRVGFTGSGQDMRADPTRSRHIYQVNEDLD